LEVGSKKAIIGHAKFTCGGFDTETYAKLVLAFPVLEFHGVKKRIHSHHARIAEAGRALCTFRRLLSEKVNGQGYSYLKTLRQVEAPEELEGIHRALGRDTGAHHGHVHTGHIHGHTGIGGGIIEAIGIVDADDVFIELREDGTTAAYRGA
jgi:hypothetical protein